MQLTQSHLLSFVAAYKSHIASVHQDGGVSPTDIQYDAPWPLDRIDQDALPLNHQYSYFNTGSNVNVYIIDTVGPFTLTGALLQQLRAPLPLPHAPSRKEQHNIWDIQSCQACRELTMLCSSASPVQNPHSSSGWRT